RQLVRDRMSSPVITIKPETTIADAEKKMNRYGHNGLVVIDANKVQGVFSRRDLAKVKDHNLMNAPVKGYMSRKVITIEPDTPVDRARELMVEYNIGRLPVVKKGKLKGIITRSDILATYYKEESPRSLLNHYGASLVEFQENVMDISGQLTILPEKVVSILQTVGKTGASCDSRVFLIGGMVRDIFTGRENTDLDFVVEENLRELLPMAAEKLQGEWSYNEEFQTGQIKLQGELNLDFALTRSERYPYPGSLPRVEKADIFTDLFRRDFTINALALGITPGEWGTLYDFFGGKEDINHRLLRALHRFSFLDDPTRIIRGLELANRLDFEFEEETATLMQEALERGNFKQLSTSRLLKELQKLFTSDINNNFFQLLRKYPVYKLLDTKLELTSETESRLKKLASWIDYLNEKDYNIKKWLLILYLLLDKNYKNTRQRLENHLTRNESEILNFSPSTVAEKILLSSDDPVNITRILDNLKPEEIILLLLDKNNKDVTDIIIHYLDHLCDIELEIDGHDLQNLGLQQGPEIKKILQELLRQKMKGKVNSRQEELDLAKKIIKDKH
ncbi:MAG: CBS domain-containing protein, partial [Halanaerobiales bacterium]